MCLGGVNFAHILNVAIIEMQNTKTNIIRAGQEGQTKETEKERKSRHRGLGG